MTDYTDTEAWARGVALAVEGLALVPPDDGTVTVSLDRHGSGDDRPHFELCRQCHHERGSGLCPH